MFPSVLLPLGFPALPITCLALRVLCHCVACLLFISHSTVCLSASSLCCLPVVHATFPSLVVCVATVFCVFIHAMFPSPFIMSMLLVSVSCPALPCLDPRPLVCLPSVGFGLFFSSFSCSHSHWVNLVLSSVYKAHVKFSFLSCLMSLLLGPAIHILTPVLDRTQHKKEELELRWHCCCQEDDL